ncbi:hypothetical protein ACHAWC_007353 [Mediolabrus comicus]
MAPAENLSTFPAEVVAVVVSRGVAQPFEALPAAQAVRPELLLQQRPPPHQRPTCQPPTVFLAWASISSFSHS